MTTKQECYNWLVNIIDSCNNDFHFECVDNLIVLFKQRFKEETELHIILETQRATHWNHIHGILK